MDTEAILLFLTPVLIGAFLLWVASWARRKNAELNTAGQTTPEQAFAAWRAGQLKLGFEIYYLGNLPAAGAKIGRLLSTLVVLFVSLSLVALLTAVLTAVLSR